MILSFVLPCYNVEEYISECLDSLFKHNLSEDMYEIICVNDCSSDGTRDVIIEYKEKFSNIRLIDHDYNKKQGGARNTGLKASKGKYIWFVDPDDFIKIDRLNELVCLCEKESLDILQFNYERVTINGDFKFLIDNVPDSIVLTGLEYVNKVLSLDFLDNYSLSVWSRLYRTDFLKSNSMFFIEDTIFEDLEYSLRSLLFAKRIKSVSDSYYCYRENPISTTSKLLSMVKGDYIFQVSLIIGSGIIKLAEDIKLLDYSIYLKLQESGIWRMNKFLRPLLKMKIKERAVFLKLVLINKDINSKFYNYLTPLNRFILTNITISKFVMLFSSIVFRLYFILNKNENR